jgi:NAD dependent epimerase/dehydratase
MKNVLVTGADGFIGSHLVEELVRSGARVKAFVMYNSFNSWGWLDTVPEEVLEQVEIFSGDIRDPNGVRTALQGCDGVYHLAALIGIPFSYHSPASYIDTNVKGTLNIVQAARDQDCKVVHTSTSEVYGSALYVPINEKHPLQGQSPYSASKIGADQLALSFYKSFDTQVSIIRPFNTYGPRQSARAVIPSIISQININDSSEIRLGSLTPTRDFSYVEDTVNGFIAVAESKFSVGEVINIGSNFEISIEDTVKIIAEESGRDVLVIEDDQRIRPEKSEVNRLWACNNKAKDLLGWEPKYGGVEGFRRGIKKTIEWFRNVENLNKYKAMIYNV